MPNYKVGFVMSALIFIIMVAAAVLAKEVIMPTVSTSGFLGNTFVFDAGHGGMDGGAVAENGVSEQDINLDIALTCNSLAQFMGMETALTRTDTQSLDYNADNTIRQNKVADIHARERITNEQVNPIFVSIHLNKFSDSSYSGAQTFWSQNNEKSQLLAQSIQSSLTDGLNQSRQAKKAENSIYLMKNLTCPAVIVECGFLSNAQEAELLEQADYHKKLAVCIVSGCTNME